jgi:hypothetical protein
VTWAAAVTALGPCFLNAHVVVDPSSNWQIIKKQFIQLPFIKKLVDRSMEKYPLVSVEFV